MAHNVWTHLNAVQEANRQYDNGIIPGALIREVFDVVSFRDVVNDILATYGGTGMMLDGIRLRHIQHHAHRALQELSFDTFRSVRSMEIEIPPSLDNPNYNDALKVPKSIDASGQILEMSEAPVLPTYVDMMIIKQGNARWLEIQTDPVSLWPYLSQFWRSQGYEIKIDEPINAKSIKFLSLHSIFAPRSKTTLIPFLFGHKADKAGLSMLSIIFKFNFEITNKAPVLPAEITMSLSFFLTLSIDNHILVSLPLLAASSGLSVLFTTLSV